MKGQKSLEFIIGLVILLVVAGTVISVFLGQFDEGIGDEFEGELEEQEIQRTCDSLCNEFQQREGSAGDSAMAEYCTRTFVADVTGDGTTSNRAGSFYNTYCEDGIKCFNVHDCDLGFDNLNAETCMERMEDAEDIDAEDVAPFFQQVSEDGRGVGTCDIGEASADTWYETEQYDDLAEDGKWPEE